MHPLSPVFNRSHLSSIDAADSDAGDPSDAVSESATTAIHYDDVWDEIRQHFVLEHYADSPEIQDQIQWFKRNPRYLERICSRAAPYLHYIFAQVKQRHLPGELVLLPIIESAYNPFVSSNMGAAGLWQIMPGTASHFGIKQNWWYDGRRDLYSSTNAALNYLNYLNHFFDNDWYLAMAAYNSGEGTVLDAIKRNAKRGLGQRFWDLALPQQTREYIPRLLAVAEIIQHINRYPSIKLPAIANQPYFVQVDVGSQIDLQQAAKLAGVKVDELYVLNPGYSRWATDPKGPFKLLIPKSSKTRFLHAIAHLPKDQRVTWRRHTVATGESLSLIAEKYDTNVNLIKMVNKLTSNSIRIGRILFIPLAERVLPNSKSFSHLYHVPDRYLKRAMKVENQKITHLVSKGDSLWAIANKYHVSPAQLRSWNRLKYKAPLSIGKELVIWKRVYVSQHPQHVFIEPKAFWHGYAVQAGDSLSTIAHRYAADIGDIKKANNLKNNTLSIGQLLKIPSKQAHLPLVHNPYGPKIYIVKIGDTLQEISHKTHVPAAIISRINHLDVNRIRIGLALLIPKVTPELVATAQANEMDYTVVPGDNLIRIAHANNMTGKALKQYNHLESDDLKPGQVLKIPRFKI